MLTATLVLTIFLLSSASGSAKDLVERLSSLVVCRQDNTSTGFIEKIDAKSGDLIQESDTPPFVFSWPHVEMTADINTDQVYIVTFPAGYPGPVLYQLDHDLKQIYAWENTPFTFFDLQYSPLQSTIYGILVTTTYGRVLSNFTLDQQNDSITAKELYTLPYMWYVNASSFDAPNSRYFALINNFPGFDNSTADQQLVIADFSQDATTTAPEVSLFPLPSKGMVQFLSYSQKRQMLYCAGSVSGVAQVAILDQSTGTTSVVFERPATAVGPLMVVPTATGDKVTVFIQVTKQPPVWELWALDKAHKAQFVSKYSGSEFAVFAGATISSK